LQEASFASLVLLIESEAQSRTLTLLAKAVSRDKMQQFVKAAISS
jgi:hypothetical protein